MNLFNNRKQVAESMELHEIVPYDLRRQLLIKEVSLREACTISQ